jgi:hypothetical protein
MSLISFVYHLSFFIFMTKLSKACVHYNEVKTCEFYIVRGSLLRQRFVDIDD